MKFQVEVALAFVVGLIWIRQILCDEISATPSINKWACTCSSAYLGNQSYTISSNCSSSCDCSPAGGSSEGRWTCICAAGGFPIITTDSHDASCFTACDCSSGFLSATKDSKKHISKKIVVITLLLCVVLATFAFLALALCYVYRKDKKSPTHPPTFSSDNDTSCNSATDLISYKFASVPEFTVNIGSPHNPITGCIQKTSIIFRTRKGVLHRGTIIQFSYYELGNATNKFSQSNLIGVGGSSHVYCGQLKNGITVAIKRLKTPGGPDADYIFQTEIELIARLHHCHVVPLLGYCSESRGKHAERLLVFEYMPNGNLRELLDGTSGEYMDWATRVTVALGAARGLEYLHEAAAPRILHRDVKSTNILLDENRKAKITDLGMAKRLRTDGLPSCSSSPARMQGTFGYFAPEYAIVGRGSLKSDVFSFGVVLLELITGRQPIHRSYGYSKGEESLVIWATPRLQDSRRVMLELPDPHLEGNFPEEEMQIMAYLAKECLLLDPDSRPNMSEVVQILSTIAPEKSKRRNFPINLFQSDSTKSMRIDQNTDRPEKYVECPVEAEDLAETAPPNSTSSARCSLPLSIDRSICLDDEAKESNTISKEYIKKLILLTSNDRSWRASDDETVDITEPRFESFCMSNIRSPMIISPNFT